MPRVKQASKKKRVTRTAVPALGAAGLTFSLAGSASASAVPTGDVQQGPNFAPGMMITLGEEEIADVSLATFHLFDDEENVLSGVQLARGCGGCGGCRGCGVRWLPRMRWLSRLRSADAEPADAASAVAAAVAAALVG